MTTTKTTPKHLLALRLENYMRLEMLDLQIGDRRGVLPIRGKNAQGKSSALRGVGALMEGGGSIPANAIHDDEPKATLTAHLSGGLTVTRRIWKKRGTGEQSTDVSITQEVGEGEAKLTKPQEMLDRWRSSMMDPIAFLDLRPQDQLRTVMSMVCLGDFSLDLSMASEADAVEARKIATAVERVAEGAWCTAATAAESAPDKPIDTTKLAQDLQDVNGKRDELRDLKGKQSQLAAGVDHLGDEIQKGAEAVENLQALLSEAMGRLEALNARLPKDTAELRASEQAVLDFGPEPDPQAIIDEMASAADVNQAYEARPHAERLKANYQTARAKAVDADNAVADIRDERTEALESAKFPVEGLAFNSQENRLDFHGQAFDVASDAERLMVAAQMVVAQGNPLRVLYSRQGNRLDADHMEALDAYLKEQDWLMLLEIVDDSEEGAGVYISDGRGVLEPEGGE